MERGTGDRRVLARGGVEASATLPNDTPQGRATRVEQHPRSQRKLVGLATVQTQCAKGRAEAQRGKAGGQAGGSAGIVRTHTPSGPSMIAPFQVLCVSLSG